jgi:hypothetical protein
MKQERAAKWTLSSHTYFSLSAFSLLILLFALPAQTQSADNSERGIHPTTATQCPSADFRVFLSAFTESIQIQKLFTHFPLEKLQVDVDADPEPKPVTKSLDRSHVSFPVIPNSAERTKNNLGIRIDNIDSSEAKVALRKEDTDYQVTYFFVKNSCWKLTRIEDWSL